MARAQVTRTSKIEITSAHLPQSLQAKAGKEVTQLLLDLDLHAQ